ncbi:uncharacterized protein [Battus philenor]|uniref:uncharacterized protein n=1 Tax=Battus philenor TaxID=42288 RepID=UPI0035CF3770
MNLVYLTALIAVCGAAKLDRTYLPPASAKTAGGSSDDIQTPLPRDAFHTEQTVFPKGAFDNEYEGVVVDAAAPGTRASGSGETGLGGPRISYGSTHSKVGGAAFKTNQYSQRPVFQNFQDKDDQVESQTFLDIQQGVQNFNKQLQRPQVEFDRVSNIVRYESNVGPQSYSYSYETDNGITAEENGVSVNGIQASGGYSYTGDDGKLYKVTYTAGDGGYQPSGDHLPTPPPIPEEILRSLEQNAREAAAGLIDDGSYDAAKYNAEGDYSNSDNANGNYNRVPAFGQNHVTDADISETFVNQNTQKLEGINIQGQFVSPTYNIPKETGNIFGSPPNVHQLRPTAASILDQQTSPKEPSKFNKKETVDTDDESSSEDDYSRPINFGQQTHQQSNNGFGNRPTYSPNTNVYNTNIRPSAFPDSGSTQTNSESSTFGSHVLSNSKPHLSASQSRPQTFPGNQFNNYNQNSYNVVPTQNFNQFPNVFPTIQSINNNPDDQIGVQNNFNKIHSTVQPSAELTTPFEDNDTNRPQSQISQNPTVPSYSFTTSNFQSYVRPQGIGASFNSNNNVNSHLNAVTTQQSFRDPPKTDFNDASQYQSPDQSYYYNQPSKPFITSRPTQPTYTSENSFTSSFPNALSTKYPQPPTVAPTASNTFTASQNQYSGATQVASFGFQSNRFTGSTKYPQPPVLSHIVPSPTSPTMQVFNKFPQYTGLTQASVSPFPSTSISNTGSFVNSHKVINGQTDTQVGNQELIDSTSNLDGSGNNNMAPQISSENYEGEIYEYNKPEESLSNPPETNDRESKPIDRFTQFGQKIPSMTNRPTETNKQIDSLLNSNTQELTSVGLSTQFGTSNLFKQESNGNIKQTRPSFNEQTIGEQSGNKDSNNPSETPNMDLKNPFEFSSRIKPCCQGSRTSAEDNIKDFRKPQPTQEQQKFNAGSTTQFGLQHLNRTPGSTNENLFNAQSTEVKYREDQQRLPSTSQTFQAFEEFGGPRRPPSFDKTSGYHY